jgi:hypothetical protein
MDGTRPGALTDAQLDRELEAALGVEASPEFLARVRTRVAGESQPLVESGFSRMLRPQAFVESGFSRILQRSVEPLWAVGIVGIVLAFVLPQMQRDEVGRPRPAAIRIAESPRTIEAEPPAQRVTAPQATGWSTPPAPRAEARWGRTVPLQLSPVLFAEDDQRVFAMFIEAVSAGQVPEEAVHRPEEPGEMEALTIEPLVIAPLPSLARTVREGEDQWE